MFDLYYKKNENQGVFEDLEKQEGMEKLQNYVPIYKNFFGQTGVELINLNHRFHLMNLTERTGRARYDCRVSGAAEPLKRKVFLKFSPLLDPVKYMVGKYKDLTEEERIAMPRADGEGPAQRKVCDPNNSAYVDAFFSYLTSQAYHRHNVTNAIDFFGSFLGVQKRFLFNAVDDLEYILESDYYRENEGRLFELAEFDQMLLAEGSTRHNKRKLAIGLTAANIEAAELPKDQFEGLFSPEQSTDVVAPTQELVFESEYRGPSSRRTDSLCSSRSSHTSASDNESTAGSMDAQLESDNEDRNNLSISDTESMDSLSSFGSDIELQATLYDFPVQVICLEAMEDTLDSLLAEEKEMDDDEWRSCLMQVIMTLLAYQKMFNFTHNDLHTNNIMFRPTEKPFLYYRFESRYYKVPTYGRLFKIIDFGRAIYKYKGHTICSDSYHPKGDAASQYNCEPYINPNKPRLEPNPSFDLCRLGCSLYDYFIEDPADELIGEPIAALIKSWCMDDKGRNILYKNNGEERYPDFKLYKMIARTVHKHTPKAQVIHPVFNRYVATRKKLPRKPKLIDIDTLPCYTGST